MVLLVALGILAFFLLSSVLTSKVNVPAVTGVPQSVATQTLKNDGLVVGTVSFKTNSTTKGLVLSQNPTAGTSVGKDTTVDLVVSNGPVIPIVTVPSVTGQQLTAAIPLITGQGLNYSVKDITSPKPVGTVISQTPAGGARVKQNVPVVLTVSGTQSEVSVPSVLGQTPAAAGSQLTHAGLNVGTQTSACSSQFQTGLVSQQSPAGGVTVQPNTPVNIVVSSGSCVSVPGVIGQAANAAQNAITAAGLVANTTFDTSCANGAQPGNVDNQNPAQGTQVANGTTVNISVCQATTTTSSSSTTTSTSTTSTLPGQIKGGGGPGGPGAGPGPGNHAKLN